MSYVRRHREEVTANIRWPGVAGGMGGSKRVYSVGGRRSRSRNVPDASLCLEADIR